MEKQIEQPEVMQECRACQEMVVMKQVSRCVMKHQDRYVRGFALFTPAKECPKCGERQ